MPESLKTNLLGETLSVKLDGPPTASVGEEGLNIGLSWAPAKKVQVEGASLDVSSQAQIGIAFKAKDKRIPVPFSQDGVNAAVGRVLGVFEAKLGLEAKAKGEYSPSNGFGLSGKLDGSSLLHYQLISDVDPDTTVVVAAGDLLEKASLPKGLNLANVVAGQTHVFTCKHALDLGVQTTYGFDKQFKVPIATLNDIFQGSSAALLAEITGTVTAAAGWSMADELEWLVSTHLAQTTNWVRCSLHRKKSRRFSFGFRVDLRATYNLSAAEAMLDQLLGLTPWQSWMDDLDKIQRVVQEFTDLDKQKLIGHLTDLGMKEISTYIQGLNNSAFNKLLAGIENINDVVALIRDFELPELDQNLFRTIGKTLAAQSDWFNDLEFLEHLVGQDIFSWVLEQDKSVAEFMNEANARYQDLKATYDGVKGLVQKLQDQVVKWSSKAWVQAILSAKDAETLKKNLVDQLRPGVEKVLGKALTFIDDEDFAKLRQVAKRVSNLLDAPETIMNDLKARLKELKGEFGVSLAWDLERLTREEALFDLEIDPSQAEGQAVFAAHRDRDVSGLITALSAAFGKNEDGEKQSILIHQAWLSSERKRTSSALGIFGSWFSGNANSACLRQTKLDFSSANGLLVSGYVKGVFSQSKEIKGDSLWLCEVGLVGTINEDKVQGGPWENEPIENVAWSIQISMSRKDYSIDAMELTAIKTLLGDLGFSGAWPTNIAGSEFAVDLSIRIPLVAGWNGFSGMSSADAWNVYKNVGEKWFNGIQFTPVYQPVADQWTFLATAHVPVTTISGRLKIINRVKKGVVREIFERSNSLVRIAKIQTPAVPSALANLEDAAWTFARTVKERAHFGAWIDLKHAPSPLFPILFCYELFKTQPMSRLAILRYQDSTQKVQIVPIQ